MSRRSALRLAFWFLLVVTAFLVSLWVIPAQPFLTIPLSEPSVASFSPDGSLLMTQPEVSIPRRKIRLWRLPDGEELACNVPQFEQPDGMRLYLTEFLPDGKRLLERRYFEASRTWLVRIVERDTGDEWLHVESRNPCAGCVSDDGRQIAYLSAGSSGFKIGLCDIASRRCEATDMAGVPIAYSRRGYILARETDPLASPLGATQRLAVWNCKTKSKTVDLNVLAARELQARFAPDGQTLVTDGYDGGGRKTFRVWDVPSGGGKLSGSDATGEFAFALEGRIIAATEASGRFNTISCWDTETGRREDIHLRGPPSDYRQAKLTASSDGRLLANQIVALPRQLPWRLSSWNWLSPLASRYKVGEVRYIVVVDVASKQELGRIKGPHPVTGCSFSPDNSL